MHFISYTRRGTLLAAALCALAIPLTAQVKVVASTPTIADLVRQVGGEHVEVESIMWGPENAHNVIAKPSHMMRLRKADLLVHTGLDAEPWISPIIKGARKNHLLQGSEGNINLSIGIPLKQVPERGQITRAQGDIHVYGNPHYMLDPRNAVRAAKAIEKALMRADAQHAADYARGYKNFEKRMQALRKRIAERMKPYQGNRVVTYHRAWIYLLDLIPLEKIAEIEPKPGIQPFPGHLRDVVELMKAQDAKVVIVETFNSKENGDFVAKRVDGKCLVLPLEVKGIPEVTTYEQLLDYNTKALADAFEALGQRRDAEEPKEGKDG